MPPAQKTAIKKLTNNRHITIKPFDKGHGIVIVNTKDYIIECERQLRNTQTDPQYDPNINILASLLEEQGH